MTWNPETEIERLMFRPLNDDEEKEFRSYVWENPDFVPDPVIHHPVIVNEYLKTLNRRAR